MAGNNISGEELIEQANYMKSLIDSLNSRIASLSATLSEANQTLSFLKDNESDNSKQLRIMIGSGIYADATIKKDKFIVPVGSGVFIEEERERTIKRLSENLKDLNDSINRLNQQKKELENNYNMLLMQIQELDSNVRQS
ncbi:prefoldin subunit alpha [Picrophilus oshimae]|uniref:Prefoldin subunit alpha n=1 Tax=Picrophilus torridus (strain ATCC 700027 / DSM 9790 / JCM 10055 / NBRC 100828 / KAW 2/3) TaxID=1122961 RepID=A0A8G2FWK9_PICTO|nr:prefoldin subunit alpha [Picrophilus oshimae]SMD30831.1 prefoldin alpha subunit [Picrophilus oshimae DSM 9789]